ncbi:MAG: hypothetical protein AAF223_16455, partial [Bacteroidota bacterium]
MKETPYIFTRAFPLYRAAAARDRLELDAGAHHRPDPIAMSAAPTAMTLFRGADRVGRGPVE